MCSSYLSISIFLVKNLFCIDKSIPSVVYQHFYLHLGGPVFTGIVLSVSDISQKGINRF